MPHRRGALLLRALHPRVIRGTLQNATAITEPVGPLIDLAATAGLRSARLALDRDRVFLAAMRAVHRAELASESSHAFPA